MTFVCRLEPGSVLHVLPAGGLLGGKGGFGSMLRAIGKHRPELVCGVLLAKSSVTFTVVLCPHTFSGNFSLI